MTLRDVSIRDKLLVLGATTSVAALLLSGVVLLGSLYMTLRTNMLRELDAQAAIVADNTTAPIRFRDPETADETLRSLRNLPSIDVACVFDLQSTLLASYHAPAGTATCPSAAPSDRADASLAGIVVVRPVVFQKARIGTVYLHGNLRDVWARLRNETWVILAAFAVGSLGALLVAARLRHLIARPLLALSTTASAISRQGDYSLRARKEGHDEIGVLVDTFNGMVSQIERRTEELREANRLKDQFLATLSHELRTPLNAIVGWLEILRANPTDSATMERGLDSLKRNAERQVRLIEDLLDVSSIASGKLRLTFETVDLVEITAAALQIVRTTAEAKGVAIVGPDLESACLVVGDAGRLEQVIWNLLSNAVKFTAVGGRVGVTITTAGGEHVVTVTDTGQGIDPAFLPHVFDRFRQGDGSRTRRHGGLGVGLAIAWELAERHGGRIVAGSPGIDQGATFSFFLPRAPEGAAPRRRDSIAANSGRDRFGLAGLRILVVDDEPDARQIAYRALVSGGAHVDTAAGAASALEILAQSAFDVMVCDIAMPGIDGYALLRVIRQQPDGPSARIGAVAATAYADDESRRRAEQAGFQSLVVKPFSFEMLAEAVKAAADAPGP